MYISFAGQGRFIQFIEEQADMMWQNQLNKSSMAILLLIASMCQSEWQAISGPAIQGPSASPSNVQHSEITVSNPPQKTTGSSSKPPFNPSPVDNFRGSENQSPGVWFQDPSKTQQTTADINHGQASHVASVTFSGGPQLSNAGPSIQGNSASFDGGSNLTPSQIHQGSVLPIQGHQTLQQGQVPDVTYGQGPTQDHQSLQRVQGRISSFIAPQQSSGVFHQQQQGNKINSADFMVPTNQIHQGPILNGGRQPSQQSNDRGSGQYQAPSQPQLFGTSQSVPQQPIFQSTQGIQQPSGQEQGGQIHHTVVTYGIGEVTSPNMQEMSSYEGHRSNIQESPNPHQTPGNNPQQPTNQQQYLPPGNNVSGRSPAESAQAPIIEYFQRPVTSTIMQNRPQSTNTNRQNSGRGGATVSKGILIGTKLGFKTESEQQGGITLSNDQQGMPSFSTQQQQQPQEGISFDSNQQQGTVSFSLQQQQQQQQQTQGGVLLSNEQQQQDRSYEISPGLSRIY